MSSRYQQTSTATSRGDAPEVSQESQTGHHPITARTLRTASTNAAASNITPSAHRQSAVRPGSAPCMDAGDDVTPCPATSSVILVRPTSWLPSVKYRHCTLGPADWRHRPDATRHNAWDEQFTSAGRANQAAVLTPATAGRPQNYGQHGLVMNYYCLGRATSTHRVRGRLWRVAPGSPRRSSPSAGRSAGSAGARRQRRVLAY